MLIFDMDGTLIDSNGLWRDVDIAFLARRGMPYTKEYYEGVAHTIFPKAAEFTRAYCGIEDTEEQIMAEWMDLAGDLYSTAVDVKPGVRAFLEQCRSRGERMVLLTSSVPAHCHTAMEHLQLTQYFEKIYLAAELRMEKKDPQIYRLVAEELGVQPEDCTFYDDSVAACRAAREAGVEVIGVYDDFFRETEEEMRQICHRYIMSFEELLS